MTLRQRIFESGAPPAVVLVRAVVGLIFVSEGIQKFLFVDALGVGRFTKIGIPAPEIMAPFVGVTEIVCGSLVSIGLLTRLVAIPLVVDMLVALGTTKIPILMEQGFWNMAHEARTDFAMLLGATFLVIVGPGSWSVDAHIVRKFKMR